MWVKIYLVIIKSWNRGVSWQAESCSFLKSSMKLKNPLKKKTRKFMLYKEYRNLLRLVVDQDQMRYLLEKTKTMVVG